MKLPSDLNLPYPDWRAGQRSAIRTILHTKKRHALIQAPTGAGKSLIDAAISRLDPLSRCVTLTATNGLLKQYNELYDHFASVKGAANYECLAARDELKRFFRILRPGTEVRCDDGPCRSGAFCTLKEDGCLYYDAIRRAVISKNALTNYAYWLAMRRYANGLGPADRLLCDEAHTLPEQLMSAYQIRLPRYELKGTRWPTTIVGWKLWASMKLELLAGEHGEDEDGRLRKDRQKDRFKQLTTMDETWAWDVTEDAIVFEPTIPRLLFPLLADEGTKLAYLSATITPATLRLLDIPDTDVETHILPSAFPLSRRPLYLVKTVRVDHRMSGLDKQYWIDRIDNLIERRLDRKGIIHTVSYGRAEEIVRASRHRDGVLIEHQRGTPVDAVLDQFRRAPAPAVLVSPAIEQGIDLPYRQCEYVIIPKMPFPDTRSKIMKARIDATEGYRDHLTAQRVVQMTGRGMRASDDQCETFIIDDHCRWFINKHEDLFPQSFLDALIWTTTAPRAIEKLKLST